MKKYLVRSAKYMVLLAVVYLGAMALMYYTGMMRLPGVEGFWESLGWQLFATERGRLLIPALVVLALFYPRFGFVKQEVTGCLVQEHRTQIENAFKLQGFALAREEGDTLVFRGETFLTRLQYLFEDEIRVKPTASGVELEGIRRAAVRVAYRLDGFLSHLR